MEVSMSEGLKIATIGSCIKIETTAGVGARFANEAEYAWMLALPPGSKTFPTFFWFI